MPWPWTADDLSANEQLVGLHASGVNSILPKEHGSQFFYLPIIKHSDDEVIYPPGLSGSSHEHRNPASPINGCGQLWEKGTQGIEQMTSLSPFQTDEGRKLFDNNT